MVSTSILSMKQLALPLKLALFFKILKNRTLWLIDVDHSRQQEHSLGQRLDLASAQAANLTGFRSAVPLLGGLLLTAEGAQREPGLLRACRLLFPVADWVLVTTRFDWGCL